MTTCLITQHGLQVILQPRGLVVMVVLMKIFYLQTMGLLMKPLYYGNQFQMVVVMLMVAGIVLITKRIIENYIDLVFG